MKATLVSKSNQSARGLVLAARKLKDARTRSMEHAPVSRQVNQPVEGWERQFMAALPSGHASHLTGNIPPNSNSMTAGFVMDDRPAPYHHALVLEDRRWPDTSGARETRKMDLSWMRKPDETYSPDSIASESEQPYLPSGLRPEDLEGTHAPLRNQFIGLRDRMTTETVEHRRVPTPRIMSMDGYRSVSFGLRPCKCSLFRIAGIGVGTSWLDLLVGYSVCRSSVCLGLNLVCFCSAAGASGTLALDKLQARERHSPAIGNHDPHPNLKALKTQYIQTPHLEALHKPCFIFRFLNSI